MKALMNGQTNPPDEEPEQPLYLHTLPFLLVAVVVYIWWPSGEALLESWDDSRWITRNPAQGGTLSGFQSIFQAHDGAWYPTTQAVTWLLSLVSATPEALALHIRWTTALLSGASMALLYSCLRAAGASRTWAVLLASLVLLHPHRAENFSWASNLRDSLALPLLLSAVRAWQAGRSLWLPFAILALGAKTMVGLFPFALPLLSSTKTPRRFRHLLALYGVVAGATFIWAKKTYDTVSGTHCPLADSLWEAVPTSGCIQMQHALGFLSLSPPSAIPSPHAICGSPPLLLGMAFAAAILIAGILSFKSVRARFGLLWSALLLAPVSGLASPLAFPVAWRYGLWVEVGVVLACAGLCSTYVRWRPRQVPLVLCALCLPLLAGVSLRAKAVWSDDLRLWEYSHSQNPSWEVKHNLAGVLWDEGDRPQAQDLLSQSALLAPHEIHVRASQAYALALNAGWPPPAALGIKDGLLTAADDESRLQQLLETRWVKSSPPIQDLVTRQLKEAQEGWTQARRCAFHRQGHPEADL